MRILLINPPSYDENVYSKEGRCETKKSTHLLMPYSLAIIAAMLRNHGFEVELYDFMPLNYSIEKMKDIFSMDYDIVLINTSTLTFYFDKITAEMVKKANPHSKIIGFGTIVTALPHEALKDGAFDIVIMREPEITALELCLAIEKGYDLRSIEGICYKEGENIIENQLRTFIDNLDSLPYPARDLLPNNAYIEPKSGQPYTTVRVSRGCPFGCTFCAVEMYYGRKWRCRSAKNIVDEIEHVISNLGIVNFLFMSDAFTLSNAWVKELCDEILKRQLDIRWMCNSRIDTVDEETAMKMADAGCWMVGLGVETASKEIISNINKNIDPEQAVKTIRILRKAGIETQTYYIFGLPGETPKTINETIALAIRVDSDFAKFYIAVPFPGTKLYELAVKNDWLLTNDWNKYLFSCATMDIGTVKPEEIQKAIKRAYMRFYLRPKWAIRFLRKSNYRELLHLLKLGVYYFKTWVWT